MCGLGASKAGTGGVFSELAMMLERSTRAEGLRLGSSGRSDCGSWVSNSGGRGTAKSGCCVPAFSIACVSSSVSTCADSSSISPGF